MAPIDFDTFIGLVGVLAELGGALLLLALFALLRGHADRRPWFRLWTRAWLALAVAIGALSVRYALLVPPHGWVGDEATTVRLLYAAYQFAKLLFYALLVTGTLMFVRGVRHARTARPLLYLAAVWAAGSLLVGHSLPSLALWQAPAAVLAFGVSAQLLWRLPPSRRTLGSRATGVWFGLLALLWAFYAGGFFTTEVLGRPPAAPLAFALRYNSLIDLLLHMTLGYGMVMLLLEERQREVDGAHAELALAHDALQRAALVDALTGALNRRAFVDGVGLEHPQATTGAVAVVDVDNLKQVNDRFGHLAGDQLLRTVAEQLRAALRVADKLYRWGGDEFLLVLPAARADEAQRRLRSLLAGAAAVPLATATVRPQASVGAADYSGAEGLEAAIRLADRRMYEDKARRKHEANGAP